MITRKELVFLYIGMMVFSIFIMTEFHEQAHVRIFEYYGVDSRIELFPQGIFGPLAWVMPEGDCNQACYDLHALNEIVGYNLQALAFVVMIVGFFIVAMPLTKKE